ncbi:MAG: bacteriohemerythrin [Candidatus Undinarchaeales archaeon]|jgi:hemerythrin|nr:bacteriohemerythrin [Candidatus Undinarchaeales archaeon]MDP7492992.1 bacteriohemerythrin [Candidatus Undinarchaeales archaeon]
MTTIAWDDSYSVGIELIDEQHKMLIQRFNNLSSALKVTQGSGKVTKMLDFMVDYTDFHFSTEEKHMEELGYPGMTYHKKQHDEFKRTLGLLIEDFQEEGATRALATSINVFLVNWLINHFQVVDTEFARFLIDVGFEDSK